MKIKFELDSRDIWNFNKYSIFHISYIRNMYIFLMILIVAFPIIHGLMIGDSLLVIIIKCITYLLIWCGVLYIGIRWLAKASTDSKAGIMGKHEIEIYPDHLIERTSVNNTSFTWEGIRTIQANKEYILIFVNKSAAHIIPKRAFQSIEEAELFFITAMKYWHEHIGDPKEKKKV